MSKLKMIGKPKFLGIPMEGKEIGECGKKAPFRDIGGNTLYTGDVVIITSKEDGRKFTVPIIERDDTKEIIILGIATSCPRYEDRWKVKKIKSYTEMQEGDKVDDVEYVKVNDKKNLTEFNIGDRIKAHSNHFKENGQIGTIVSIDYEARDCAIRFDENVRGWSDEWLGIEKGYGVHVLWEDLELIKKEWVEMTIDQIEKKLGHPIKIIGGKVDV